MNRNNINWPRGHSKARTKTRRLQVMKDNKLIKPVQTLSRLQSLGWKEDREMYVSSAAIHVALLEHLCGVNVLEHEHNMILHPFDIHAPVMLIGSTSVGTEVVPTRAESVFVDELDKLVSDVVVFGSSDHEDYAITILGWIESETFKAEAELRDAAYFPVSKLKKSGASAS